MARCNKERKKNNNNNNNNNERKKHTEMKNDRKQACKINANERIELQSHTHNAYSHFVCITSLNIRRKSHTPYAQR